MRRSYYRTPATNYVDTWDATKYSNEASPLAKSEKNDCVVRATAAAFEVEYDRAHAWVAQKMNRQNGKGTRGTSEYLQKMSIAKTQFNGKKIKKVYDFILNSDVHWRLKYGMGNEKANAKLAAKMKEDKMLDTAATRKIHTAPKVVVKRFLRNFKKGTYFVIVRRHAFTIKDGVIMGNRQDAIKMATQILYAYQIG